MELYIICFEIICIILFQGIKSKFVVLCAFGAATRHGVDVSISMRL